jgi:hypothetical protein
MTFRFIAISLLALALAPGLASAAFPPLVSLPVTGTTDSEVWGGRTSDYGNNILTKGGAEAATGEIYGSFPGSLAWPAPIPSATADSAGLHDATLNRVSGTAYPGLEGVYSGGISSVVNNFGGQLRLHDATALTGLQAVALQLVVGEAWGYGFYNGVLPTLSYNGGTQNLAPTYSSLINQTDNGIVETVNGPELSILDHWGLQWDLSGLGTITSFTIDFTIVQHAVIYAAQLDQSNQDLANILPPSVPEPGTAALAGLAALGCFLRRRRR